MEITPSPKKTGLKRSPIDKFYTKSSIVDLCLSELRQNVSLQTSDLIIEPSAGNGAFLHKIKRFHQNCIGYDILPDDDSIIKQDYLEFDIVPIRKSLLTSDKIYVIGNPPFGKQSSLARKFIKKSAEFCDGLAFILPKSFKKDAFMKAFPLHFHLLLCIDLPSHSFEVSGKEHDVPCVFQIWTKRSYERNKQQKLIPNLHYEFVGKSDSPHFSFRRVGVNAGTLSKDIQNKSCQSHYFIKLQDVKRMNEFYTKYNDHVRFDFDNTAGPKSISKNELISKLNNLWE